MRARFRARRRSRRPSHERCHHCYERSNEAIQSRCNRSRLPDCLASLAREIDDTRPLLGVATWERTLAAAACAESFEPVHRLKLSTPTGLPDIGVGSMGTNAVALTRRGRGAAPSFQ